jgi:hypothetical protein
MPSSFSWLDHSERERRRVLDAIDKFSERDTRDELGLGPIRDGFADLFFPGTSTIQTRARYFLFIPWIYQRAEARTGADKLATRVRNEEVKLRNALMGAEDLDGVVGKRKGAATKRLPSSIYWLGLFTLGIRMSRESQDDYHRFLEQRQRRARETVRDDDGDRVDGRQVGVWDPRLPKAPDGFPDGASFNLTEAEAQYLEARITLAEQGSLFGFLVRSGRSLEGDFAWAHPQYAEFPSHMRVQLEHARMFAETMQGAALLYNLMLSEELPAGDRREELAQHYSSRLSDWCSEVQNREGFLARWDRGEFWALAHQIANVRTATQRFVDSWLDLEPWRSMDVVANGTATRTLIRDRELRLKGKARARLGNPRALENWGGEAGTARLTYRWEAAKRILADIYAAKRPEGSDA